MSIMKAKSSKHINEEVTEETAVADTVFASKIRTALGEEQKAASVYYDLAACAEGHGDHSELKTLFMDLAKEELVHVGELNEVLKQIGLDAEEAEEQGEQEAEEKLKDAEPVDSEENNPSINEAEENKIEWQLLEVTDSLPELHCHFGRHCASLKYKENSFVQFCMECHNIEEKYCIDASTVEDAIKLASENPKAKFILDKLSKELLSKFTDKSPRIVAESVNELDEETAKTLVFERMSKIDKLLKNYWSTLDLEAFTDVEEEEFTETIYYPVLRKYNKIKGIKNDYSNESLELFLIENMMNLIQEYQDLQKDKNEESGSIAGMGQAPVANAGLVIVDTDCDELKALKRKVQKKD